jgi:L-aminoadipate-semialdehyde dehydrogenase
MKAHSITVTHLTPAMGQVLVGGSVTQFPALRNAFFVGDLLTKKDCTKLRNLAPNTDVINLYGSTETQRAVSYFPVPSKNKDPDFLDQLPDIIPIGQGMLNVQLLVIDQNDRTRLCAVGEQGEIYIRAAGLAEGYLGTDKKTAELNETKFVTNWFTDPVKSMEKLDISDKPWAAQYKGPRDRIYKTGDIGRIREDGSAECVGRVDLQVKIRGFRIELGEIDVHLSQHKFVRENITVVRRDKDEEQTLVTYFVPETKRWIEYLQKQEGRLEVPFETVDESMAGMLRRFKTLSLECKQYLATKLPKYAVPSMIIPLARMPLSMQPARCFSPLTKTDPNGKIDRPSLPFPDSTDLTILTKRRTSSVAARMTDTQLRLAKIWASVLPNRTARMLVPDSNFFDEGGHSILAQQMFFLVKKEWRDIDVPVNAIFQAQTLAALAAEVDRALDPIGLRLDAMPLPADGVGHDEAYAADARDLVRHLPTSIQTADRDWSAGGAPPTIFLTGATGFLGSYILHELLQLPINARVVAHVRAKDAAAALARLESISKAYGLWSPSWLASDRLSAVVGDISKPQLGLSTPEWTRLAASVDVVVHNGAQVNWMLPYSSLRAANVLATLECVRLCTSGRAKTLAFVSSTSTLDSEHYIRLSQSGGRVMESDDLAGSRKGLATGYGQSKWASEFVVREAGRRGLRGAVVRPGYVTGDPATGVSVTDDFLVRLWKGCVQVGARPAIPNSLNAVPVPRVARVVAAAALGPPAPAAGGGEGSPPFGVLQVTARPRASLDGWMSALDAHGYAVLRVPYELWRDAVKGYVGDPAGRDEFALLPLFHFVVGDLRGGTVAPEMDDAGAARALAAYEGAFGLAAAAGTVGTVDTETMGVYLAYLVGVGFLPAPRGVRELPRLGDGVAMGNGHLGGRSVKV